MSPLNPYERLPDLTLLAALVGREAAHKLLAQCEGSLDHVLREANRPYDSRNQKPPCPLGAAVEIVKRAKLEQARSRSVLSSPELVRDYLKLQLGHLEIEVFVCLMLDPQNHLIEAVELFRGTFNQASVYPREVVKRTLAANSGAVILVHNHPSGSPEPSAADLNLTSVLKNALSVIDVRVLDHLIVAGNRAISLAERGQL